MVRFLGGGVRSKANKFCRLKIEEKPPTEEGNPKETYWQTINHVKRNVDIMKGNFGIRFASLASSSFVEDNNFYV